jgi:hypothetical protein
MEPPDLRRPQQLHPPTRMQSGLKEDFVRVQIPDACHDILAEQEGLERTTAAGQ